MRTNVSPNSSSQSLRIATIPWLLLMGWADPTRAEAPPAAIPVDHVAETALLAECGTGCLLTRSAHFVVASGDDLPNIRTHLQWMEQTFRRVERFLSFHDLPVRPLRSRLEVVQVGDWTKLARRLARPSSPGDIYSGFFDPTSGRSYFGTVPRGRRPGAALTIIAELERVTIQHETAHQAMHALSPTFVRNLPDWLSEGLACAFEVATKQGDDGYRSLNRWRAQDAIAAFAPTGNTPTDQPPLTNTKPAPTSGLPNRSSIVSRIVGERHRDDDCQLTLSERYAGAWAILFFLQNERPDQFKTYLHRLAEQDTPPSSAWQVDAFLTAFGGREKLLSNHVIERAKAALAGAKFRDVGQQKH